ncbi:MAG TPA: CNNM domain-containing protein, partial [Gemmatimonadales bacterium]|nr:CNNM domain-containing protein [Gemmatimonadales bacterium]
MDLLILLALILLNGVFAMSEMSVVAARKSRLQQWVDEGRPGASGALALANEPGHFLSTIQVGITVIGVLTGAIGGMTVAQRLEESLARIPWIGPHANAVALGIVVAGITVASVIFGELVPKRIALLNPEGVASVLARPLQLLSRLAYPAVRALALLTDLVLRLLGAGGAPERPVSEEEINVLMEQGAEAGV